MLFVKVAPYAVCEGQDFTSQINLKFPFFMFKFKKKCVKHGKFMKDSLKPFMSKIQIFKL